MRAFLHAAVFTVVLASAVSAQPSPAPNLLDRLAGEWILEGTIAGRQTTHDVSAVYVLNGYYLQLHEVSREKDATGRPAYEAIVYLERDPATGEYRCLWLDSTAPGGLDDPSIGHAGPGDREIRLLFPTGGGGNFHTTFAYDAGNDTWQWIMDGEENGALAPFARVTLRRK